MFTTDHVELRAHSDVVLTRSRHFERWLERGFERVPEELLSFVLFGAFPAFAPPSFYAEVWRRLFPRIQLPPWWIPNDVMSDLADAARGPMPQLYVLERAIERGERYESVKFVPRPLPPRTTTEHYVVIEAVTDGAEPAPVAGLRLELIFADGEIRGARTDANGVARVERIQAGRVVIRVLDLDGEAWHPLDGPAAQRSSSSERVRTHVVKRGECMSKIALQYGIHGWKRLWEHPGNAKLRKKRKSPHVLLPGDNVAIPGIDVHEIIRPTDATHRIEVTAPLVEFRVVLQDHNQLPYKEEAYELRFGDDAGTPPRTGMTDAKGTIVEPLAASTRQVEVFLPRPRLRWALQLGALLSIPDEQTLKDRSDPNTAALAVEAMQTRLVALGFPCGPVDGKLGPRTLAGLALWQGESAGAGAAPPGAPDQRAVDEPDHALLARLDDAFEVTA